MQEPPGKLVTEENINMCGMTSEIENINMCGMTSEITHLWACDKVIFRTGIPVHCLGIDKEKD